MNSPTAIGFQEGDDDFLMSHVGMMIGFSEEHCSCGFVGKWHPHFEAEADLYVIVRRQQQREKRWREEWR